MNLTGGQNNARGVHLQKPRETVVRATQRWHVIIIALPAIRAGVGGGRRPCAGLSRLLLRGAKRGPSACVLSETPRLPGCLGSG